MSKRTARRKRRTRNRKRSRQADSPVEQPLGPDRGSDLANETNDAPEARDAGLPHERSREPARLVGPFQEIKTRRAVLLLCGLSLLLCCLVFPGIGWWPLAYVCLVPWLVCVCTASRGRFLYFASYLLGLGFFLINIRWIRFSTPPGYLVLCAYNAAFFPLAAWLIRHAYRRHSTGRKSVPWLSVAITAPIVWIATEYLRSIGPLGFPWLLLGHSQYKLLSVIQISDLVGAYGVSFVLVMVNGWLTDLLIGPILMVPAAERSGLGRPRRTARLPRGSLATLLVVAGTLIYGGAQQSMHLLRPGPKIAVVQHDIPMYVDPPPGRFLSQDTIFAAHLALAREAAAKKPDLIVLPETVVPCYMNDGFLDADRQVLEQIKRHRYPKAQISALRWYQDFGRRVRDAFQKLSTDTGIPIVLGASSIQWKPTASPPRVDAYNSAFLIKPGRARPSERYDKQHLVLFGEYIPFRYRFPKIYEWLNSLTPWGRDGGHYSLTAGERYTVFSFKAASLGGKTIRAGTPICYEEVMPYIARDFTRSAGEASRRKNVDLLLSLSNDGWFLHSAELEQHLAGAVFRAVENRIAIARSVNTGTSALVYPNGRIHRRVTLSPAQIAKLDPLAAALRRLDQIAARLQIEQSDTDAYDRTLRDMNREPIAALRDATGTLGQEFDFIFERLNHLRGQLPVRSAKLRRSAIDIFTEQLSDDLATVRRWRQRPWTAPGVAIDTTLLDPRLTLYTRFGDWFALLAVGLSGLMLLDWFRCRRQDRAAAFKANQGDQG